MQAWVTVYQLAKSMNLAQVMDALKNLAEQLNLPGGDGWLGKTIKTDGGKWPLDSFFIKPSI